jgi:hypothetical protein
LPIALDESDIDAVERGAAHQADGAMELLRHPMMEPQTSRDTKGLGKNFFLVPCCLCGSC